MSPHQRTEILFAEAKKLGLVGLNGDGAPTQTMVASAIVDAGDYGDECSELAVYVRRLVRIVRKTDPENAVAKSAVEFLKCIGQVKALR